MRFYKRIPIQSNQEIFGNVRNCVTPGGGPPAALALESASSAHDIHNVNM